MRWLYTLPNTCIVLLFGLIGAALFVGVLFLRVKLLLEPIERFGAALPQERFAAQNPIGGIS
jgi:hypothetical protein